MGFNDFTQDEEQQQNNDDSKVSYIYVRSEDDKEAYDLMSNALGGSAFVRSALKGMPDEICTDQHDFFQQFIVALEPAFRSDDYTDLLEFLMVDADNIAQYLDQNDEVRKELINRLAQSEELQEAIEAQD